MQSNNKESLSIISKTIDQVRSTGGNILKEQLDDEEWYKKNKISSILHEKRDKIYTKMTSARKDIFNSMSQYKYVPEGKKLFASIVNKSDIKKLMPYESNEQLVIAYSQPKNVQDYPDNSIKIINNLESSPNTKINNSFPRKMSYLGKIQADSFDKNSNVSVFNSSKQNLILQLHENKIDYKQLIILKNAMLNSEQLIDGHLLPIKEFDKFNHIYSKDIPDNLIEQLLKEILTKDGENINIQKLMNLIDLFILIPFKKKIDKNHSSNIYEALSKR